MWLFGSARRVDLGDSEAFAAPPKGQRSLAQDPVDAGAPAEPEGDAGDAGAKTAEANPIDLAVAPDGGVPRHADGTTYRSPFAKPNAGQAVRIKVGLLLNSVDDYDIKSGTFKADFFLSMTSTVPMPSLSLHSPNGKLEDKEAIADKPTFKLFRYTGQFKAPPDLRRYPFDSQDLRIVLEDDSRGSDQVRFVVDKERTQLARTFRALGWQVNYVEARSISQPYQERFEGDDLYYGRYIFTVGVERYATSAAFKVYVPAFVIVIIALLGMWVPPNEMEVRSNAGSPMLAAAVLFHFSLMQELPSTMYLTRADKLMLGVYVSLALGMISTWWMFLVREEKMMTVFRAARIVVPLFTVAAMGSACLF
ncbi:Hypothetical protein A7982_00931 [Minicystis rosea]|nr:Hypothetical protein A7982_00931 [Minicystis rosea]